MKIIFFAFVFSAFMFSGLAHAHSGQKTIKQLDNCRTNVELAKDLLSIMAKTGDLDVRLTFNKPELTSNYSMQLFAHDQTGMMYGIKIYVNGLNHCTIGQIGLVSED